MFKETKVIKRPTSTTRIFELMAHDITNVKELNNIFAHPYESITMISRFIDSKSFQPCIFFMVKREPCNPYEFTAEYYCMKLEAVIDAEKDEELSVNAKAALESNKLH